MSGAILGAVYIRGAEFFLPNGWDLVASGAGILALLLLLPEGLGGAAYAVRDRYLRSIARWKGVVVPSMITDSRTEVGATALSAGTFLGAGSGAAEAQAQTADDVLDGTVVR